MTQDDFLFTKIKRDQEKPGVYVWKNLSLHLIFDLEEGLTRRVMINYQVQVTAAVEMQVVLEIQSYCMINHSFQIWNIIVVSLQNLLSFSEAPQPSLQNG